MQRVPVVQLFSDKRQRCPFQQQQHFIGQPAFLRQQHTDSVFLVAAAATLARAISPQHTAPASALGLRL